MNDTTDDPRKKESRRVDRLLSRNISFTSAEILTVSEVKRALTDANSQDNVCNQSIRFTARLVALDVEMGHVQVADPNDTSFINMNYRQKTNRLPGYNPYLKHHSGVGSNLSSSLVSSMKGNASGKLQHKVVKRPLQSRASTSLLGKRDISNNRVTLTNPQKSNIVASVSNSDPTRFISIDIHAVAPLEGCKVGDLIMIIGETRISKTSSDETATNSMKGPYVEARIIRNCNGLDVQLQEKAFLLRREYLMDRFGKSSPFNAYYNPTTRKQYCPDLTEANHKYDVTSIACTDTKRMDESKVINENNGI